MSALALLLVVSAKAYTPTSIWRAKALTTRRRQYPIPNAQYAGFTINDDAAVSHNRTALLMSEVSAIFGYRLLQSVIASGGDVRQSDSYRVGDTFGEPVTSGDVTMQSVSFKVSSGFLAQSTGSDLVISVPFSITLQGHPSRPHARWLVPLRVSLTIPGEDTPAYEFEPTTDENGHFTLTGIEVGTYEIRVKHAHTLQNMQTVTLTGGNNTIDLGILREGDANDDNFVTIIDFSILAATFAKCEGTTGYDPRADFNGDGCITIIDFSLLASNFGEGGQNAPMTANRASEVSLSEVVMSIEPAQTSIKPGEAFNVTVRLDAGEQQVDGAQLGLNFDPDVLEVEEVMTTNQLDLELANQVDNESGTIQFAAGTLEAFPSGEILVMEIQFKALKEGSTALTVSKDSVMGSDVTFAGASVLGELADGVVTVNEPTAVTIRERVLRLQLAGCGWWLRWA